MDFANVLKKSEPHLRTIIHLDMDYFYAQVEEIRDASLRDKPLGIQQKNIVVTCNYIARQYGVGKLMLISEAKQLCPTLVLVKGEDLTPYRAMSQRIFDVLLNYTPTVEKLGLDENFMDVTALVDERKLKKQQMQTHSSDEDETMEMADVIGHIIPADGTSLSACDCGCAERLVIGTQIAKEVREELHSQLGIKCCAGISYNKLLAKLVGSQNKPNQQTVLVSSYAEQFMRDLKDLHRVTGIGQKTESLLLESGIANVEELQRCDMDFLRKKFGFETATKLRDLSFGKDVSVVRPSGKPKTIGLEDSCRTISVLADVEERFRLLLMRLVEQVAEDGRIPIAVKVILRKFDPQKKTSHRETKQANILPSLFKSITSADNSTTKVILAEGAQEKLLKIIMRIFERVVDLTKAFNITLIGLAFSKFQQRKIGSSSIANFLIKKADLEVQSITSLTNPAYIVKSNSPTPSVSSTNSDEAFRSSPTTFQPSNQFYRRRTTASSPIPMLTDNGSESAATNSDFSDFSETEVEPSPKKSRIGRLLMAKRRCLGSSSVCSGEVTESPSKLRVCDLRLNSRDSEKDFLVASSHLSSSSITSASATTSAQMRTVNTSSAIMNRIDRMEVCPPPAAKFFPHTPSTSTLSTTTPMEEATSSPRAPSTSKRPAESCDLISSSVSTEGTTISGNLSNIPCPSGVDPQVFNELPLAVQNELITSWRNSLTAAVAANSNVSPTSDVKPAADNGAQQSAAKAGGSNATQKNTLYRYFLRNK